MTPIEESEDSQVAHVFALGTATVFGGNVAAARQSALQSAYAEAVALGAGTEIGRMTLIRNVRAVTDVVSSSSRGFVKRYEVVGEQLIPGSPSRYELRIRAESSGGSTARPRTLVP